MRRPRKTGKLPFGGVRIVPSTRKDKAGNPLLYKYKAYYTYKGKTTVKTFASEQAAIGWLASERKLIDLGQWTPLAQRQDKQLRESITVADMVKAHIENRRGQIRPNSHATMVRNLRLQLMPHKAFTCLPVTAVTRADCKRWHDQALAVTNSKNGLNYVSSLLTSLFEEQVAAGLIQSNPMKIVKHVPVRKVREVTVLEVSDYLKVIDQFPLPYQSVALLCYLCGLRISEARAVQLGDISTTTIDDGQNITIVSVRRSLDRDGRVNSTKTASSSRDVPVLPQAAKLLNLLVALRRQQGAGPADFLSCNPKTGRPIEYPTFVYHQRKVCERLNLPTGALNSHNGRRAVITDLINSGVSPKTVAAIVGHSTTNMTLNVYAQTSQDQQILAVTRLGDQIENQSKGQR